MPVKFETDIVDLSHVIDFYKKDFIAAKGKIIATEYFVDATKGKVIFRIMVDEPEDNRPG